MTQAILLVRNNEIPFSMTTISAASTTAPPLDINSVREQFPILQHPLPKGMLPTYLDNGASTQKPRCVIDTERDVYETHYANAYRGVYQFGAQIDDELEASRATVQRFLNAKEAEEIIFTAGTTMSINLVAHAWGRKHLQAGDRILLSEMEHHANIVPWQMLAQQTGAVLDYLPITGSCELDLADVDRLLTDRTKMVAVTAMSNVLGTLNPIREITERAHAVGAVVLVDAAQSVAHLPTDVQADDVDFLAFSGHKVYGPTGVGVLYGKRALLEDMDPFLGGGHMIAEVHRDHSTWADIPAKFEAGTLPITQAISLKPAIDFVKHLGFPGIHAHEQALLEYAHQRLAEIPGMQIHGPAVDKKGAICSMSIENMHPEDLANLLDRKGVFVRHGHHCTMPLHQTLGVSATTRASFAVYNTTAEIDTLLDAIHFARGRLRLV